MNDYDTPEIRCSLRNLSRVTECISRSHEDMTIVSSDWLLIFQDQYVVLHFALNESFKGTESIRRRSVFVQEQSQAKDQAVAARLAQEFNVSHGTGRH